MKIEKDQQVTQKVAVGIKCDVCGKETNNISDPDFFNFNSHHDDWGSDSDESYENHDVCSSRCYFIELKRLIIENSDSTTFEADGKSLTFLKVLTGLQTT